MLIKNKTHLCTQQYESSKELNLLINTMKAPSSRHVSFSKRVKVKRTLAIGEYTRDEMESTWYESEELQAMALDVRLTVQMIGKGEELDEASHCQRGVENRTSLGKETTRSNRRNAVRAVLKAQEHQRRKGIKNQEELASVYTEYTKWSGLTAQAMGLSDEQVAQKVNGNNSASTTKVVPVDNTVHLLGRSLNGIQTLWKIAGSAA
jgi:ribosome-binding protein aMBF1 (putative translation factor)